MGCSQSIQKRRNEAKIKGSNIIPVSQFLDVFDSVCKIETSEKEGTGFLLKINKDENNYFYLVSNEHVISKKNIKREETINITYKRTKKIKITLDKEKRYIKDFTNMKIDATIVEILKTDQIKEKYFLEPDPDYLYYFSELKNKDIWVAQFLSELKMSEGKITVINEKENEFTHLATTIEGSSGSPIFLVQGKKVLGIHKQGNVNNEENYGSFIGPIISYLMNEVNNISKQNGNINNKKVNEIISKPKGGLYNIKNEYIVTEIKEKKNIREYIQKLEEEIEHNDHKEELKEEKGKYYIGKNELKNGKGKVYYSDNNLKYIGDFKDGVFDGIGKYIYKNGIYYEGMFLNGKKNGNGIMYFADNSIMYEGFFSDDKLKRK